MYRGAFRSFRGRLLTHLFLQERELMKHAAHLGPQERNASKCIQAFSNASRPLLRQPLKACQTLVRVALCRSTPRGGSFCFRGGAWPCHPFPLPTQQSSDPGL